jgi:hypothetical protein
VSVSSLFNELEQEVHSIFVRQEKGSRNIFEQDQDGGRQAAKDEGALANNPGTLGRNTRNAS